MTDLTVLLGPNSAGKSSFLHALAFFFENTSLDAADVFGGEDQTTSVECIFGDLTDTDRVALGPYALGSQVVLRRSWTPGGDSVLTGRGRRFPRFEEVRSKTGREFTAAYKSLRDELAHPDLPEAKNVTAVEQAMLTFEQEHPESLRGRGRRKRGQVSRVWLCWEVQGRGALPLRDGSSHA